MSQSDGETPPDGPPASGQQPPPPPQQPQWNPQSAYPVGDPRALPAYPATNPYAQQPYAPGQPGMPQFPTYALPDHPKATAALVVGIVSVAGMFVLVLPVLAAPVAWVLGAQARGQIRRAPHQWGGESKATAGMVLGIIGTILLLLVVLIVVIVIIVAVNDPSAFDSDTAV